MNWWVRSRNCGCLVTWFCYQLIAKPGNKRATVLWPDPYEQKSNDSFVILVFQFGERLSPKAQIPQAARAQLCFPLWPFERWRGVLVPGGVGPLWPHLTPHRIPHRKPLLVWHVKPVDIIDRLARWTGLAGIILCMRPANERWRYNVTASLVGWAHAQKDPWAWY